MLIVRYSTGFRAFWRREGHGSKENLTTARELKVKKSEGEAARGGVRPGGVLRPIRSENELPPLQTEERGIPGPDPV